MSKMKKVIWIVLLALFLIIKGSPTEASAAVNLGGVQEIGSLKVTVNNGSIFIERYSGAAGGWQKQYYATTGAVLDLNRTILGLGGYFIQTPLQCTSEVLSGNGTTATTVWNTGTVQITQKVTLPSTSAQYIMLDWSVKNIGSTALNELHFLRGHDSYLAGGDNGAGYWNQDTLTVGVQKTLNGIVQRMGMQAITVPNSYASKQYNIVNGEVADGGTLSNQLDTNESVDNGYALEWYRPTLLQGDTWRIVCLETFVSSPVVAVGDSIDTNTTGEPVDLVFEVVNSSSLTQAVTYTAEAPAGWDIVLERTGDTLTAGQRKNLKVTVTPVHGAPYGVYNVVLNVSTANASAMAMGTITLYVAPEAPNVQADDERNLITGIETSMEYSNDGGETWKGYDINNIPVFEGNQTVLVRLKAAPPIPAGEAAELVFTYNRPAAPNVEADDENNVILNADLTMEYSANNGTSWIQYDGNNIPTFNGNQTVLVRIKESAPVPASNSVTLNFTADPDWDEDGIPNNIDDDDDNDGTPDSNDPEPLNPDVPVRDIDEDGIPNSEDPDDDNDGIPDSEDAEPWNPDAPVRDIDGDGIPNSEDPDDDNDGIPDNEDSRPWDPDVPVRDTDGDGIPNSEDTEPENPDAPVRDIDGDGIPNSEDPDDDNDGVPDSEDADPWNPDIPVADFDGDGIPNSQDPDDDNDGVPDSEDSEPWNPDAPVRDIDGDGIPNSEDPDDDNDGIPDSEDSAPWNPDIPVRDTDGDGIPNSKDTEPKNPDVPVRDIDGDGIPNSEDPDDDNDGIPDSEDAEPWNPDIPVADFDGDGIPNSQDPDDDNDGVPDGEDPAPMNPAIPGSEEEGTGSITGSITDESGMGTEITVTIEAGNTVIATQNSLRGGAQFTFLNLPYGIYNVVADNGSYRITNIVEITKSSETGIVHINIGRKQSKVVINTGAPDVAVGGLNELFTAEDNATAVSGGAIEIKLIVARQEKASLPPSEVEGLQSVAGSNTIAMYLDLSVIKTITEDRALPGTEFYLSNLINLIEVAIPIPANIKGKAGITAYRIHNGVAEIIPNGQDNRNADGEYSVVEENYIRLFLKKFSTYAIGYTAPSEPNNPGNGGGNNGGNNPSPSNPNVSGPDTDGDGIPDSEDPDDDNDGIPDSKDPAPLDPKIPGPDTDGDGIPDSEDPDDDNDGIPDSKDSAPLNPKVPGSKTGEKALDDDESGGGKNPKNTKPYQVTFDKPLASDKGVVIGGYIKGKGKYTVSVEYKAAGEKSWTKLDPKQFNGNTSISIKLTDLKAGTEYALQLTVTDKKGNVYTTSMDFSSLKGPKNVKSLPKTGESSQQLSWAILACLSAAGMLLFDKKRKNKA